MTALELVQTDDPGLIAQIYSDEVVSVISTDQRTAAPINHPLASYLAAYVDGVLVGGFLLVKTTRIETDLHALLWRCALPHSREFGRMCIATAFASINVMRVTAYVSQALKTVRNYCMKLGFTSEGIRRDACSVNGIFYGVETLGMTRKEWSEKWGS